MDKKKPLIDILAETMVYNPSLMKEENRSKLLLELKDRMIERGLPKNEVAKSLLNLDKKLDEAGTQGATKMEEVLVNLWNAVKTLSDAEVVSFIKTAQKPIGTSEDYINLAKKLKDVKLNGVATKFSGQQIQTSDFWKEITEKSSDEPKTDAVIGKLRSSIKVGKTQIMSGEKKEALATLLTAAKKSNLEPHIQKKLKEMVLKFAERTRTEKLTSDELKSLKLSDVHGTVNKKAKIILDDALKMHDEVTHLLNEMFGTNAEFKRQFALEAASGIEKFSDSIATADHIIALSSDLKQFKFKKIESDLDHIMNQMKIRVAIKSQSWKVRGVKMGYGFYSSLRVDLADMAKSSSLTTEVLSESILKYNDTSIGALLNEISTGNIVGAASEYILNVWNKIKDIFNKIVEKIKQLIESINKGLHHIFKSFELDEDVQFNENIDWI